MRLDRCSQAAGDFRRQRSSSQIVGFPRHVTVSADGAQTALPACNHAGSRHPSDGVTCHRRGGRVQWRCNFWRCPLVGLADKLQRLDDASLTAIGARLKDFYELRAAEEPERDPEALLRFRKAVEAAGLRSGERVLDLGAKWGGLSTS